MTLRSPTQQEEDIITAMITSKPGGDLLLDQLAGLLVEKMDDGHMGSLLLVPVSSRICNRRYGQTFGTYEYRDADDVLVSMTLNLDEHGQLLELDSWKVDFSPLLRLPNPADIVVVA